MHASRLLSDSLRFALLFAKYGCRRQYNADLRLGLRQSVNYLAMDSAREAERAVQSFAVQSSLLRRVREPNLDFGGR